MFYELISWDCFTPTASGFAMTPGLGLLRFALSLSSGFARNDGENAKHKTQDEQGTSCFILYLRLRSPQ